MEPMLRGEMLEEFWSELKRSHENEQLAELDEEPR